MTTEVKCEVCREQKSKYKCPKCRSRYCSVPCYKKHKESDCSKDIKSASVEPISQENAVVNCISDLAAAEDSIDVMEDKVSLDKLQRLGESQELLSLLDNPHLRHMMTDLTEKDPQCISAAIEKAMHEPVFTEFADTCLSIIESRNTCNVLESD